MPPANTPLTPTTRPPNPAADAALAELLQLALTVARATAALAEIEGRAIDALAATAVEATRAAAAPAASLEDAIEAGRHADASDAARDAIAARLALITDSFEKAARAVRRTIALQARLADPRPFARPRRTTQAVPAPRPAAHPAPANPPRDAEPAERPDRPETGNELAGRTADQALQAIHRDLASAAATRPDPATSPGNPAAPRPAHHPGWPAPIPARPAIPASRPAPDT